MGVKSWFILLSIREYSPCPFQVDGQSHVVHSEEEALGTRLTIDSLTCLMANETDPSKLLAISPGKLMRYLVPDESHVQPDQPYAEIEVRTNLPVRTTACALVQRDMQLEMSFLGTASAKQSMRINKLDELSRQRPACSLRHPFLAR